MALITVQCGHCQADNEINVPDGYAEVLRWECRPCGGVSQIDYTPHDVSPAPAPDLVTDPNGPDSQIFAADAGAGVQAGQ